MINKTSYSKNDILLSLMDNGLQNPITSDETEQIIEQEKSKNKSSLVNNKLHLLPQRLPLQTLQYAGSSEISHYLTENQKAQIAREVYEDVKLKDGFYEDTNVTSYLESLISEINTKMELSDSPNKVKVINSKEENAFVTTDKYIYITKGLLNALETEEEILAVFTHELGHVKHKHLEQTYEKDEVLRKNGVNQLVKFILKNEYSKECEFQADQFAVDSLIKMGRNPIGIRVLFGHFKEKEDKVWNKFKEELVKEKGSPISEDIDEKSKKEKEEKTDKIIEMSRFVNRLTRTHPYASERLERAYTLINHDLANIKDYSLKPKGCKLDEEEFIKNLTGTFDEKLKEFNERYPDGKEGRIDMEAQDALFEHATKDGSCLSYLKDERGVKLNLFAKEHATTLEEFKKIFGNHKIFHRDNIEIFLLKMTQNKLDKINEIAKLWGCDFINDFLAYGYSGFELYIKESYGARSIRKKSKIIGDSSQQYYWAKVFGFRYFVREHLFKNINTREDMNRVLNLPFMSMAVTNIERNKESSYSTNEVHSSSLYNLAKKIYKNETDKDLLTPDFWRFIGNVFGGRQVDWEFFYKMSEDIKKYYVKTENSSQPNEFQQSMKELAKSFSDMSSQKYLMQEVSDGFDSLEIKDFARLYCGIFDIKSEVRDNILFSTLNRRLTLQSLKSYLPYFTFSRQNKINKIIGRNDKELTFNQKLEILEEFYPAKSVNNHIDSIYCEAAYIVAIRGARRPEEVIKVCDIYSRKMKQDKSSNTFFSPYPEQVKKFLHPSNLKKMYGANFSKYIEIATEILNCISLHLSPGIDTILKIIYDNATNTSNINDAFTSFEDINKDAFTVGRNNKWAVFLGDALDKGIELSAKENNGDFNKVFEDLNKWHNDLQRKSGTSFSLFDPDQLANIIEEKFIFVLQRYGKSSQDAVKVINEFRRHRLMAKNSNSVIGKVENAIKDFKTGCDKNIALAGFTGYFLDKVSGKLPQDINDHLNLVELLMPEPALLRNDILMEFLDDKTLSDSAKIRISDMLYSYKEKENLKLKLYDYALKESAHNEAISYRDRVDYLEKYFNEPSRTRDKILTELENKHAQSINETKYSSHLKFDKCNEKEIKKSSYFKDNKYLLDPKNRVQSIALTSSGSIINILLRYFKGPQSDEKDQSDEEKALYGAISNLEPIDRKNIIKEMLVGLEAFEKKHLQDIKIENRTGGFSVKAWKEEFINKIIDSFFKESKGSNGNNFMTWLIKEVFNESSVDRSASIISELIEAKTSNLKEEEAMFQFLKACGPIARKLGQILSSNSMVPEKYQKEFSKLKLSEETPIDKEEIIKIIDSEINGKINERGAGINIDKIEKLLGSASIRTVYKVKINGKEYVAKINDPRSRSMAVEDLEIMDKLSKKLEESPELLNKFKIRNPKLLLHNLTLSLFQDIDSRIEDVNSKKLENVITQEGNHTSKIFYAGPNVVLEEFVDGKGLHKGIKEFNLDGDKVIDKLFTSYAAQLDRGIFHADPHSENIMVTRGGDVYWIDKSMQGDFTKDNLSKFEKNAVFDILFDIGAFGHLNVFHGITAGLIMKHLDKMAKIKPDFEEKEKIKSAILETLKNREKSSQEKFQEIYHVAEKGGYIFSDNIFMFGKSVITLSGEIKKINPNADIGKYLRKVILMDEVKRSFSDIYHWIIGKNEETNDFLRDNRIDNMANIPWERLADERKISKELLRASKLEFKDVQTEEDGVSALKKIFLRHGQNITIQDIEFINSILKETKTLQILQQHIAVK